ncbi:D-lactate dehydrogenase [Lacunisphaera limnophila]|uniref:D-lactate dehydrogenase n=1 Tax=Lacunisphaera limnophila TaxID=1838286 RepID=A0A1D8AV23_9BACT|nr:2-hydroxyacid dehydrogenase [Lacunisphaera limnophila]AOS44696.1 D-lactate dehydrogenase [Lacunisphaera limnophila]
MRVVVFSTKPHDRQFLDAANAGRHDLVYLEARLLPETATLAAGAQAACLFVHDHADAAVLATFAGLGVKHLALRCAGFNNVDLAAAARLGITVARVPAYSPHGVAEHAVALFLTLNRRIHRAYNRVRDGNFSLDGLLGFDVHGKTVGVIGTGKIGLCFAQIMRGFGCRVLAFDVTRQPAAEALGVEYTTLERLYAESDLISLHCPLTPQTQHLIGAGALAQMRDGVYIVNTSRGPLIDTGAVIDALKSGRLGALALDVYEEEEGVFYEDLSGDILADDQLARLLSFPNVLVTSHQAFFTREAVTAIAATTLGNLDDFAAGRPCPHALKA